MNSIFEQVAVLAWTQLWQVTLVATVVLLLVRLCCHQRPYWGYLLLLLVMIKCVVPPVWSSSLGLFSWHIGRPANSSPFDADGSTPFSAAPAPLRHIGRSGGEPINLQSQSAPRGRSFALATSAATAVAHLAIAVWALGVLTCLSCLGLAHIRHCREIRRSSIPANEQLISFAEQLVRRFKLRRSIRLLVSSATPGRQISGPHCFGVFWPTIVLPEDLVNRHAHAINQIEPILAHELIHLRRGDSWAALLQVTAVTLWWFHPLIWWVSRQLSREREKCCDQAVVLLTECDPADYSQAIIDVLRFHCRRRPLHLVNGIQPIEVTQERLEAIMNPRGKRRAHTPRLAWTAMAVGIFLVIPGKGYVDEPENFEPSSQVSAAGKQDNSKGPDSNADFRPPKLLYLAWQDDIDSTGRVIEHNLWWDTNGQFIDLQETEEVARKAKFVDRHWRKDGALHPLVLVFGVEDGVTAPAYVLGSVILPDGKRHPVDRAQSRPVGGRIASTVAPKKIELPRWPSDISLEISYPLENLKTIRTVRQIPDEPIEVGPGVTWYVDESQAADENVETGELARAEKKVAAVLRLRRDPEVPDAYGARVYLRGRSEPLNCDSYTTLIEVGGVHETRVSEAFAGKEEIEKIEFVRQRRARHIVENVPLHPELLTPNRR